MSTFNFGQSSFLALYLEKSLQFGLFTSVMAKNTYIVVTFRIFFVHTGKAIFLYKYVRRTFNLSKSTSDFFFCLFVCF